MRLPQHLNYLLKNRFSEKQMATIAQAILELATDNTIQTELPDDIDQHVRSFMAALEEEDPLTLECALINLYIRLHSAGSRYSPSEKRFLKKRNSYLCHPGGLSPLILAGPFIKPESVVADLGAGNGLQGLLLQRLYPHRKTLQIELSAEMIRVGRILQQALWISDERVEWINGDIADITIDADFIYIYRPARPLDGGEELYQSIACRLGAMHKPLVIFSVADCLGKFLDKGFSIFYSDGHLTCFSKQGDAASMAS
ncbi:MAG: hypothetical protein ACOYU0_05900 [Nitrospirota bacterium]